MSVTLLYVLAPGQPRDERVEDREQAEADGQVVGEPIELIRDERAEEHDHRRVGPELVPQHRDDEDDLGDAVAEQVERREGLAAVGELAGRVQDVAGFL